MYMHIVCICIMCMYTSMYMYMYMYISVCMAYVNLPPIPIRCAHRLPHYFTHLLIESKKERPMPWQKSRIIMDPISRKVFVVRENEFSVDSADLQPIDALDVFRPLGCCQLTYLCAYMYMYVCVCLV